MSKAYATPVICRLVDFIQQFEYAALSASVISQSKTVILDTLGAIIAASNPKYSASRIISNFAKDQGGTPESSIIGRNFKTNCVNAALVNGTLGYYCDIESHHVRAILHAPASNLPTALAVGERAKANGKQFLAAFTLGVDVACRVSHAIGPTALYDRGFHPSCVAGAFGTAANAAYLLGLNQKQFANALGLVATQACGLLAWENDPTENSRPFNPGIAARNGTTAALLASMDFGGPPDVFEERFNIFDAWSVAPHLEEITDGLGECFAVTELAFKRYASCAFTHPGLDALLSIMETHHLSYQQIQRIVLRFPKSGVALINDDKLKSHSGRYVLAVGAYAKRVLIDDILRDRRAEPEIRRLHERIEVVGDESIDPLFPAQYTTIIEVTTTDGRQFSERVDYARGCPENPMTREELGAKYFTLTEPEIGRGRAEHIRDWVDNLEAVEDISVLGDLLRC
ncbi:MmgE/PrpD family protein [Candidatus Poribacteria bacterium]|nr:MmgE/PrpD family protein [Candidatus Poribacteria bacterium]